LHDRLVALAGIPDDAEQVPAHLGVIAQLAAGRIEAVAYASLTSRREGSYVTVAASHDPALALDEAQYADDAGPCLEALDAAYPAAVPDIAATITWPGFREAAARFGLQASLSIPLFAGSGATVAALNLYSRRPQDMGRLSAAVWFAYANHATSAPHLAELGGGGRELATGLADGLMIRDVIQRSIGVLVATHGCSVQAAYLDLRDRAAGDEITLADAALRLLAGGTG
jgi:hypothetical protein